MILLDVGQACFFYSFRDIQWPLYGTRSYQF